MTASPRVLHVITRLTMGGSSENTIGTLTMLGAAGFECVLAVSRRESEAEIVRALEGCACRVVDVPMLSREVSPLGDLAAVVALARLMRRERPAIVHTHTSKAGFVGRLAARLAGIPVVIHQPHGHVFYGYWGRARTALFVRLERLAAHWADRIVTLTERGTVEHLALRIGRREQYVTIPSGVPTADIRARALPAAEARGRLGLAPNAFVIAGVGRFVRVKGFDLLVEALPVVAAAVPSTRVLLIGEGPERGALEARARTLGIAGRLTITGAVGDVPACLAAADVLAAPSRNEGMGRALVEAMALGIPVVGAAVGGIPSVVADGECGELVPAENPAALASALVRLARDPNRRAKLGEAARRHAERFSVAESDRRLVALYRTLLGAKGAG